MPPVPAPDGPGFAVILAGGSGRRLGLVDKPGLLVAGRRLVDIALVAVAPALTVVVGPDRVLPSGVFRTREDPPGGGPAAGLVAGLQALADQREGPRPGAPDDLVVVLAADLPGIDRGSVLALTAAVRAGHHQGAVLRDPGGRSQYLAGVWRWRPLQAAAARRPSWSGGRLSELLEPLIGTTVAAAADVSADVDRPEDLVTWHVAPAESRTLEEGS